MNTLVNTSPPSPQTYTEVGLQWEALFAHVNTYVPRVVLACDQRLLPRSLSPCRLQEPASVSHLASFWI